MAGEEGSGAIDTSSRHDLHRHLSTSSRPTTPLRPPSRSSIREAQSYRDGTGASRRKPAPLENFEPAFSELSEYMMDLESNFMHLHIMHDSLARFSESFASFLYGLNMNAFCVDFPEAPTPDSLDRAGRLHEPATDFEHARAALHEDTSFMTTDTFIDNPAPPSKVAPKLATPNLLPNAGSAKHKNMTQREKFGKSKTRGTHSGGLAKPKVQGIKH